MKNKNWLESLKEEFDQALASEDAVGAHQIISYVAFQGFNEQAETFAQELHNQEWYCDICEGEGTDCVCSIVEETEPLELMIA